MLFALLSIADFGRRPPPPDWPTTFFTRFLDTGEEIGWRDLGYCICSLRLGSRSDKIDNRFFAMTVLVVVQTVDCVYPKVAEFTLKLGLYGVLEFVIVECFFVCCNKATI